MVNRSTLSLAGLLGILACSPPLVTQAPVTPPARPAAVATPAQPTRPAPEKSILPNEKDSVKFAVIGDSGTGGTAQYQVGKLLNDARARFPYEFVIMMGDNMYGGQGPAD